MKNLLITTLASLALGATTLAFTGDEACSQKSECPVATKVNTLLTRWEAAAQQAKSQTPAQREAFGTKVAAVASQCPVGSRMGAAITTVGDVLGFVVALNASASEDCPLESAECAAECSAEELAQAKQLKAARVELLAGLSQLTTYASGAACSKAVACEASSKEACAAAGCCAEGMRCPIRMAARIGELKASFVDARGEARDLTTAARGQIGAGFASLGEQSDTISLMPETVVALAEGLDALTKIHAAMSAFGQANPGVMAKVPASAQQAFMMEVALVDESRQLVVGITETMALMAPAKTAMR